MATAITQPQRNAPTMRNILTRPTADLDISLGWHVVVQVVAMGLALYMGFVRRDHTYDRSLVNSVLGIMPVAFLFGMAWFMPRLLTAKDPASKEMIRMGYVRFGERFWVSCITILVAFCLLTPR